MNNVESNKPEAKQKQQNSIWKKMGKCLTSEEAGGKQTVI